MLLALSSVFLAGLYFLGKPACLTRVSTVETQSSFAVGQVDVDRPPDCAFIGPPASNVVGQMFINAVGQPFYIDLSNRIDLKEALVNTS